MANTGFAATPVLDPFDVRYSTQVLDLPSLLSDLIPIPQDDGPRPLAQISYSDAYVDAMGYLRALMAANELSDRTLLVTAHVISMNPAHYTCWGIRLHSLFEVAKQEPSGLAGELGRLRGEIKFLDGVAVKYEKNYQIWHHRQLVMERIGEITIVNHEQKFMEQMFGLDAKNYHVWSYRQWLVRRFGLFPRFNNLVFLSTQELSSIDSLLAQDVRNNSAWNHRHFLLFGNPVKEQAITSFPIDLESEIDFVKSSILIAPQNASAWTYLLGIYSHLTSSTTTPITSTRGKPHALQDLFPFLATFVDISTQNPEEDVVVSSHALEMLADLWAERARGVGAQNAWEKDHGRKFAAYAWKILGEKYDPIRKNYWEWKRREMERGLEGVTAARGAEGQEKPVEPARAEVVVG
ncbi:hypothetical protein DFH27DRAFT_474693 [Peziza echinospora]|nr:hypothetical protein DFH27DRAFT_474693 [Peziza echinospora]